MNAFNCPACGNSISAAAAIGATVLCPHCRSDVTIPPPNPSAADAGGVEPVTLSYAGRRRKTFSIGAAQGLVMLAPLGIALVLSVLLPIVTTSQCPPRSERSVCAANLRGIGQAMYIYAMDEPDSAFPDDLQMVILANNTTPKQFICPSGPPGVQHYYYVSGQTTESAPKAVVMFEDPRNHGGDGHVLYVDGFVEFVKFPEYQRILDDNLDQAQ